MCVRNSKRLSIIIKLVLNDGIKAFWYFIWPIFEYIMDANMLINYVAGYLLVLNPDNRLSCILVLQNNMIIFPHKSHKKISV